MEDFDEARQTLILTANTANAPLVIRIPAALQSGLFHWKLEDYHEAHESCQAAIGLLSTNNLMAVSAQDLQALMRHVSGLGSVASSIALVNDQPEFEALRCLEAARCVISELTMRGNTDLSELRIVSPDMAERYADTSTKFIQTTNRLQKIERPALSSNPPISPQSLRELQQTLLRSMKVQEDEIRTLEGFENFQQRLTEPEMKKLAHDGPIIAINVSIIRSDAFIVTENEIKSIPLPSMTHADLQEKLEVFEQHGNQARNATPRIPERLRSVDPHGTLSEALQWLWDTAVGPILEKTPLKETRRVWWITCGLAGRAPLHAAGYHSPDCSENTISKVESSYVSSFKALYHARTQLKRSLPNATSVSAPTRAKRNMLLVTVPKNPPYLDLDTSAEERVIQTVFGNDPSQDNQVSLLDLHEPNPATVLSQLSSHAFVHFACHGVSVEHDPSQSGLVLVDMDDNGQRTPVILTVARLEEMFTEKPLQVADGAGELAYLSACSTAEQSKGHLADEAIHLANSLQALGFRHVVATMWGADDQAAGDIARRFYEALMEDEEIQERDYKYEATRSKDRGINIGRALHRAITGYRATATELFWCPFIHIGV